MEERVRFVSLAESGKQSFASLCREYGISRKTGYKWLGRKREFGLAGLKEMSRKPRSNIRSVADEVEVAERVRLCFLTQLPVSRPEPGCPAPPRFE